MKDLILLHKICKYRDMLNPLYDKIKNLPEEEITDLIESYALTQILTNIYSVYQLISNDDISLKLFPYLGKSLSTCRNIASHDYDSLSWVAVKSICRKALSNDADKIIVECIAIAEQDESEQKDYTNIK